MAAIPTPMTVEEFLRLPEVEGQRLELIHGEVVEVPYGKAPHEVVKKNLNKLLVLWLAQNSAAELFVESSYCVDDENVLIPDLSVLFPGRVGPGTEWIARAPEIAIEVVSSEPASRLEEKTRLYLANGAKSVWAIYPTQRAVWIYDTSGGAKRFEHDQSLTDPTLPGFSIPTSAIFEGV
jgi:Uma2 family endonuclease